MTLSAEFVFNQGNLQDYVDCRRRFRYRHLLRLPWPAVESEPRSESEARTRRGLSLHRLIHQQGLGLPLKRLSQLAEAEAVSDLWLNYLQHPPTDLPPERYPEAFLSAPLEGHQLLAKYDLLAIEPGKRAVIVDWKTSTPRSRRWLAARMQTRVYRYLLVRAGAQLFGAEVEPEAIEMLYWFASDPGRSVRFEYSHSEYEQDQQTLSELIVKIQSSTATDFQLTDDATQCLFCSYRSLCNRGVEAGQREQFDDQDQIQDPDELQWESIMEFEF